VLRYREIKSMLSAEIAKMKINDRLPPRPELCKQLDTTRATLDKAINELVREGALFSRKGDGTYVADAKDQLTIHKGNWGVIVPDVTEGFYSKIVRGVENVAQSYGINLILCNTDSNCDKQEQYIKRLSHSGVSGIILVPFLYWDPRKNYRLLNQLTELKVPFVFCNRSAEGINAPVITSNNFYGSYIATKHLLEKGYRNIAYISPVKTRSCIDRCQGYITALTENGIDVNQKIITFEDPNQAQPSGYAVMKNLLASGQIVDAVFCYNDKVAQDAYRAIADAGLTVSDDIGVVGYDDDDLCEKVTPAITSMSCRNLEVGTKAAEVLYKLTTKEDFSDYHHFYLFKPDLIVRGSCLGLKNRHGTEEENIC
jgi:DNA-binding LacI/PurR family transcriptional regulator